MGGGGGGGWLGGGGGWGWGGVGLDGIYLRLSNITATKYILFPEPSALSGETRVDQPADDVSKKILPPLREENPMNKTSKCGLIQACADEAMVPYKVVWVRFLNSLYLFIKV